MIDLGPLAERTFDAIIFDLDETLISSGEATRRSWMNWALEYGISEDQFAGATGRPSAEVVALLIPEEQRAEAAARIEHLELNDLDDIVPLPGAKRAFDELPLDKVAIATSCTKALLAARHGVSGLPEPGVKVWIELAGEGKPSPASVLKAAELLGVDPARTLVVEDAPAGIAGAKAAGAATLAVMTTTARESLHADATVANLDDISWQVTDKGIQIRPTTLT